MARRKEPTPEISDIIKKREFLIDLWAPTHQKWEKIDSYIHRSFPVWPEKFSNRHYPSYHPSRANGILDHAVDNQLAFNPTFTRNPTGRGDRNKERADAIEKFLPAIFLESSLMEPILTEKQIGRHLLAYGYSVREGPKWSMDEPEEPQRMRGESQVEFDARMSLYQHDKRNWMPVRMRAPHPARVLMDPMEKVPTVAIRHQHWFAYQLEEISRSGGGFRKTETFEAGENPFEPILCDEYWSRDWHALVALDPQRMIMLEPNLPGFVPYSHIFAGFGQEPTAINSVDPQYMAVGILEPILDDLRVNAQAHSALHNAIIESAFREWITTGDAQAINRQRARGVPTIELRPGESLNQMPATEVPQWLFQAVQTLDADMEFGTFAKNLAGIKAPGVDTVGQQAQLTQLGQRRFAAPSQQLEHSATQAASGILRLIDTWGKSLTVQGHTISPADIQHDYSIQAHFELVDPVLNLQRRQMGMQEFQLGLKSKPTYWASDMGLADVSGEMDRIAEDKVNDSPEVQALIAEEILRRKGLRRLAEVQAQLNASQAQLPGQVIDQSGQTQEQAQNGTTQALRQLTNAVPPTGFRPPRVGQAAVGSIING